MPDSLQSGDETIRLWLAYPEQDSSQEAIRLGTGLLSQSEQARLSLLRFDKNRREYLFAHVLVRLALSHSHSISAQDWQFRTNAFGKPSVEPDCGLRFNLSRSSGLAACVIANGIEVGVDAEPNARSATILEIGEQVFSPRELAQLDALDDVEKPDRALSIWTLKEAYVKARGIGLSQRLTDISFLFGDRQGIRLELDRSVDDEATNWCFCLISHVGYRIAIVIEQITDPRLELWELYPLMGCPMRRAMAPPAFYPGAQSSR